MKLSYSVEYAQFEKKLAKAAEKMGGMTTDLVKAASSMFAQSVIKATPQARNKKRVMSPVQNSIQKKPAFYLVKWRRPTPSGSSKKGAWVFSAGALNSRLNTGKSNWNKRTKDEIKRHLPITYRGMGKAAWLFSAERIGVTVKTAFRPSSEVSSQSARVAQGQLVKKGFLSSQATLINRAWGINRYGERAATWAIAKTGNRIMGWVRSELKKGRLTA